MADYGNPYLQMPQQEAPNPWLALANMVTGLGAGISQGAGSGGGWASGIGPGLLYGAQLTGQQQQATWQRQLQTAQHQSLLDHRRAQEEATREKTALAKAAATRDAGLGTQIASLMGLSAPISAPQMGPGTYETRLTGLEGGTRNGGMVYNELGSGAGGPYQIMPATWTDIRAKNPDLNLPEVMPVDNSPQSRALHDAAHARFKAANAQALQTAGFEPTPENLYYAHRFGAGGATSFLRADPNKPLSEVLPIDWQRQNPDMRGQTVGGFRRLGAERMGGVAGPQVAQGDAIAGQGDAPTPQNAIASLPAEVRAAIGLMAQRDPEKALQMTVQAIQNQKKEDVWTPLSPESAKMFNLDPAKSWQMNKVTRKIEPVGGAQTVVNIDQKAEAEFGKEMGKMDAKRFGAIIEAEGTMNDMASKLGFALDQFKQTYTGPGAEAANQLNRILGAAGFEEAGKKANAADAAQAVVSQMKPHMRAAGSGASSDKDMDMFAKALPSLMNLPDGNERIVTFFQKMADRASKIRELAQEHSEGGKVPLTRTQFDAEVKKLGPLFSEEEKKLLEGASKPPATKTERPPISSFGREPQPTMTPGQRPPLSSFGGGR
jgi:hypothetical protein